MKRFGWKYVMPAVVLLSIGLFARESRTHIPYSAGGSVDIETDMKSVRIFTGRLNMIQQLSHELKLHPMDKRFRVLSSWGDCGISGRRAIVYDRTSGKLLTWFEGHNERYGISTVTQANYEGVSEDSIHNVGLMDDTAWRKNGRKHREFDFVLDRGGIQME